MYPAACCDWDFLFGKRKNAHGEGSWAFPRGYLEFDEFTFSYFSIYTTFNCYRV